MKASSAGRFGIECASGDDALRIAQVHVASWVETYRGLLPDALIDRMTVERRAGFWSGVLSDGASTTRVWVARRGWEESGIVGFCSVSPAGSVKDFADWELGSLYLLQSEQRQGIGRALFAAACAAARGAGARAIGFWVLRGNLRAERFYAACGAMPKAEKSGRGFVEVGYRVDL